ncbi:MAG: tetratricopeptide repeat protein [Burkholderiales bacterium]|nr:tetratricopeptide repeat protein [Burkholderiales bacterium]
MRDKQFCHYHHENPATWRCQPCKRLFGDCCMPINLNNPEEPRCPLCRRELAYLGAANTAKPFWERILFFFGYAMKKRLLCFYLLATIGIFLSFHVPFPLLNLLLLLLVFCAITKYLCAILIFVSEGETEAPPISRAFQGEGFWTFLKIFALSFVFLAVLGFASTLGLLAVFLAGLLITLLFPAMIIVLVLEDSLAAALNPRNLTAMVGAMGWHYLILWVFLFIVMQSSGIPVYLLTSASLPLFESTPSLIYYMAAVICIVSLYFYAVMFSMMGYAVYQYQGALGNVAGDWTEAGLEESEYLPHKARALAEIYVREGRHDDALAALKEIIKAQPKNMVAHERYHRLLLTHGTPEQNHAHLMRVYLPLLLSKMPDRAIEVYFAAKKKLGNIPPPSHPMICETLAQELIQKGHPAEGMQLVQNFYQRFPDYPHTPRVYLMAAKTSAYLLRDPDAAHRLIAFIREHYPQSQQIVEANALEMALDRHSLKSGDSA